MPPDTLNLRKSMSNIIFLANEKYYYSPRPPQHTYSIATIIRNLDYPNERRNDLFIIFMTDSNLRMRIR